MKDSQFLVFICSLLRVLDHTHVFIIDALDERGGVVQASWKS